MNLRSHPISSDMTTTWTDGHIAITFSASSVQSDYGVPHSPTFYEAENISIESVTIFENELDLALIPDPIMASFLELASEVEWRHS